MVACSAVHQVVYHEQVDGYPQVVGIHAEAVEVNARMDLNVMTTVFWGYGWFYLKDSDEEKVLSFHCWNRWVVETVDCHS